MRKKDGVPVSVDFSTATTAGGKLCYARDNGLKLPDGKMIDRDRRSTNSPADYFDDGAILPLAGPKGSGLGMIGELLGYALLGEAREFNWFLIAVRLSVFGDENYLENADRFLSRVANVEPAEGFEKVTYPGQIEQIRREEYLKDSIPVSDGVRGAMRMLAEETGVSMPRFIQN